MESWMAAGPWGPMVFGMRSQKASFLSLGGQNRDLVLSTCRSSPRSLGLPGTVSLLLLSPRWPLLEGWHFRVSLFPPLIVESSP